jgi:hypothetical protein
MLIIFIFIRKLYIRIGNSIIKLKVMRKNNIILIAAILILGCKTQFENKLSVVWDKLIADVNGLRNVFDKL